MVILKTESGGYKSLPFFKQSEIIYDFTVKFVKKYIDYKSRTKDQMEQAARSGKQNIPEGYLQKSIEGRMIIWIFSVSMVTSFGIRMTLEQKL